MTTEHSSHYYDTDRNRMLPEQERARGITDAERAAMTDTKQTVLTNAECIRLLKLGQSSIPAARAIESAVVAKLRAAIAAQQRQGEGE